MRKPARGEKGRAMAKMTAPNELKSNVVLGLLL